MQGLTDITVENKTCLVRVDFNCPLNDDKTLRDTTRIRVHAETLQYLADQQAKVVVIAHQGRPGDDDFTDLAYHTKTLQDIMGSSYSVSFLPHTHSSEVENAIQTMKPRNILVLDNVRLVSGEMETRTPEEHAKAAFIKSLASVADIFVNDAFSVAHRSHMSMVGFTAVLPSYAGLIMEREIQNLERATHAPDKPCVFILGGIKPKDSFQVANHVLSKEIADHVLTGGVVSQLLLLAEGKSLGPKVMQFLEQNKLVGFLDSAKQLLADFGSKIKIQTDFACDVGGRKNFSLTDLPLQHSILDIGDQTIGNYTKIIANAATTVFNGPMGKFEEVGFEKGTLAIFKAMSQAGFSLAGGGHSISIIEQHSIPFSYVSTAGKAMLRFLMGQKLVAIEALRSKNLKRDEE